MKNKIVLLLFFSFFVFTLTSCTNDTDESFKLLTKVVETTNKGTSQTYLYVYNGNQIMSIDGSQDRTDFTYTDGLISKMVTINKTNQLRETTEYSYIKGKLVRVLSLGNYKINYIHNSDKIVSYERFTLGSGNEEIKEYHGILYFDNENLIKEERIYDNTLVGVDSKYSISFDYDSKNNPLYNILGYKQLLDYNEEISSNNTLLHTVITSVTKDDQITSSANFYKSSYTYDSDNYPIERVSETEKNSYLKAEYFY
jgi:hypothetical protein